jgi:uncharacterized protein
MASADPDRIRVEVVYALPGEQALVALEVPAGTTAGGAIERSGLSQRYAAGAGKVGIFGRIVDAATVLQDGDRVEIYRPLVADPKTARRQRASRKT